MYRPRLNEKEYEIIKAYRDRHTALKKECEEKGVPIENVNHYWYKSESFSMFVKPNVQDYEELKKSIIKDVKTYAPVYIKIERDIQQEPHAIVIDPADIHIGKLAVAYETGDEYNREIAVKRVKEGVSGLIKKALPYNVEQIFLIIGNDVLHVDNAKRTTTSGTPQDTDGMWFENFLLAKRMYIEIIEMLMSVANVKVIFNPSNHDYTSGFFLAQTIEAWFSRCSQVEFDTSISHRKYFDYGKNLIGTTHGDGAKTNDLALLMAHEAADKWALCPRRYFYTHHVHHKTSKDLMSVTVESMRSISGTDSWHHRNGYQHSPKAIECFLHHKELGQVSRQTHYF